MKVFVAGATGALGKQLVPLLVANGHEVVGHDPHGGEGGQLRSVGAQPVVVDALDADAVAAGGRRGRARRDRPPADRARRSLNLRHFDREFALTNRLRTEGTDHLLSAGRAVGRQAVRRPEQRGWPYARTGGPVKTEEDPLDPSPPPRDAPGAGGDPSPRGGGRRRRLDRGDRAALRRVLRPRARRSRRPTASRSS